jgi:hypothetical protein
MANVGQAVLDIVGLVATIYTGNPLWFALASEAGMLLYPQRTQGPKLSDTRTTTVTLGAPVPLAFGTVALGGNVMYLGPLSTETSDSGGKGGPGSQTTYTYFQSIAVGLCEGPPDGSGIVGLQRIWENGTLVYDTRPQGVLVPPNAANPTWHTETASEYSARLTANAKYAATFVLYRGTSTQLPDPTIEADKGAGNVPAFRGLAYIVYPNRQLQQNQGLRHPTQWKFEVVLSGVQSGVTALAPTFPSGSGAIAAHYAFTMNNEQIAADWANGRFFAWGTWSNDGGIVNSTVLAFDLASGAATAVNNDLLMPRNYTDDSVSIAVAPDGFLILVQQTDDTAHLYAISRLDPTSLAQVATAAYSPASGIVNYSWNQIAVASATYSGGALSQVLAALDDNACQFIDCASLAILHAISPYGAGVLLRVIAGANELGNMVFWIAAFVPASSGTNTIDFHKIVVTPGATPSFTDTIVATLNSTSIAIGFFFHDIGILQRTEDGQLLMTVGTGSVFYLIKVDPETAAVAWKSTVANVLSLYDTSGVAAGGKALIPDDFAGTNHIREVDTSSGIITSIDASAALLAAYPGAGASPTTGGAAIGNANLSLLIAGVEQTLVLGTGDPPGFFVWPTLIRLTGATAGQVDLGTIITRVSERCGLQSSQLDVSDLTSTFVDGYAIASPMDGRSALDPLRQIGMFDAVVSDLVIRFQKRGKATVATLTSDDLGAYQAGEDAALEWEAPRALEQSLPRMVRVTYIAPSRDYDNATAFSPIRMTSSTVNDLDVQLPVALEDSQAAQIAEILWQSAWAELKSYSIQLDQSWSALEGADPILVPIAGRNLRMRIAEIDDVGFAIRKLSLVSDDSLAYTSTAVAPAPVTSGSAMNYLARSQLFLLDSVLLRDLDDTGRVSAPLYLVVSPTSAGGSWGGAVAYDSPDESVYAPEATLAVSAAYGTATTALGDVASPFVTDTANTLTVRMSAASSAPASITDLALLNGGNAAALIDPSGTIEILQFRDVTVNSDGTVTLAHLLRGRRGSETMTGGHVIGSIFVMLNNANAIGVDDLALGQIGVTRYWKAVTNGDTLADATAQAFQSTGRSLMPRAPWNVSAARVGSDIHIDFDRRSRLGADEWLDGPTETAPLNEDAESYEIDIYSGSSVVRTLSATGAPPVTYPAASITADFGSMPAALTLAVYQMSGQVGRGFAHKITVGVS